MASFRVHEDQENRVPENRQKLAGNGNTQQKRTVLGVIDNRLDRLAKSKQVRGFNEPLTPPLHLFSFLDCGAK